jgi:hypothetical protein
MCGFDGRRPAMPSALITPLLAGLLIGSLFLTCCHKPAGIANAVLIEHQVDPQPPRVGPAAITLRIWNDSGQPVQRASVRLEGNMTHAGMAPSFGDAVEVDPGRYRAPLEFSMGGDWIVLVHITLPNGEKMERQFDVKGVRPN